MYYEQQVKLGQQIKEIRKRKGFSQQDLAYETDKAATYEPEKYIPIHKNTIGKLECGKTQKSRQKTLATIAHCLGLPDNAFEYAVEELSDVKLLQKNAVHDYLLEQDIVSQDKFYSSEQKIQIMLSEGYDFNLLPFLNYLRYSGYEIRFKVDESKVNINNYMGKVERNKSAESELKILKHELSIHVQNCKAKLQELNSKQLSDEELKKLTNAEIEALSKEIERLTDEYEELNAQCCELEEKISYMEEQIRRTINKQALYRLAKDDIIEKYSKVYNFEKDINDIPLLVEIVKMSVHLESEEQNNDEKIVRTLTVSEFEKLCSSIENIIFTILEC